MFSVACKLCGSYVFSIDQDKFAKFQSFYCNVKLVNLLWLFRYENGGSSFCYGDYGGPLTCRYKNGDPVLVGTVSYNVGCGEARKPGIYTRITSFKSWIEDTVNSYGSANLNFDCGGASHLHISVTLLFVFCLVTLKTLFS